MVYKTTYQTIYHLGLLAVALSSFSVALIVYIKAWEDNLKSTFLLVNTATGMWASCLFIFHSLHEPHIMLLRLSHLIAIFIPVTFIHFVFVLLDELSERKKQLVLFYLLALLLGLLSFTKFSITGITYNKIMGYHLIPGSAYRIFSGMFFFLMTYGYLLMIKALKKSKGFKKNQIRYFLLGSFLGFGGAISTFFPIYKINIPPLGIWVVPGYGIILAYAILKRRLMDMRAAVSKSLIYSATTLLTFLVFLFIGFKIASYSTPQISFNLKIFLSIWGFLFFFIVMLSSVRRRLEKLMEKLIFKKTISSSEELIKGSQRLMSILDEKKLSRFFLDTILKATGAKWGSFWLLRKDSTFHLVAEVGKREKKMQLSENLLLNEKFFSELFKKERKILTREELFSLLRKNYEKDIEEEKLRISDFSLVIPLFFESSIKGWAFLGEKTTESVFSSYEIQALTLFSEQTSIALTNAQLFQKIQKIKEYNEKIINNVNTGLLVINKEGKITTFNKEAERITSLPSKKVLYGSSEILPPPLSKILSGCWQKKEARSFPEIVLEKREGEKLILNLKTSFINEEEGKGDLIVLITDITEVKNLEERIRQTENLANIGSMVTQLAHEIKNPLSSIKTFTELLPERFQEKEFREEFFSLVSKEVERVDNLINKMLNLGKVSKKRYRIFQIEDVIKETLFSFNLHFSKQDIKVRFFNSRESFLIRGDLQSLKEAFSNIIFNSIQAMPKGGTIAVNIRERKSKQKELLEISITDEGGGIPEKYISRIFEPFFTTKPKGTGLGLYICYQIIKAHEGKIKVENTEKGAKFTILLPLVKRKVSTEKKRKVYG